MEVLGVVCDWLSKGLLVYIFGTITYGVVKNKKNNTNNNKNNK